MADVFQPGDKVLLFLDGCPPLTVVRVMPDGVRVCVHWFDTTGGYHENAFHADMLRPVEEPESERGNDLPEVPARPDTAC